MNNKNDIDVLTINSHLNQTIGQNSSTNNLKKLSKKLVLLITIFPFLTKFSPK
ncbi:MAG: hypothetical protein RSD22_08810 [Romboutsia sp.]